MHENLHNVAPNASIAHEFISAQGFSANVKQKNNKPHNLCGVPVIVGLYDLFLQASSNLLVHVSYNKDE